MEPPKLQEYEVEVIWTYRVKVQAASLKDARERGVEEATERSFGGQAPDSEDVDVIDGPEDDDDE